MVKHPAGPFTVRVTLYSLAPGIVGLAAGQIYCKRHRSPNAAARNLAGIIANRTPRAKAIRRCVPVQHGVKMIVETGDGSQFALHPFRAQFAQ